jgi:hypothetical protein
MTGMLPLSGAEDLSTKPQRITKPSALQTWRFSGALNLSVKQLFYGRLSLGHAITCGFYFLKRPVSALNSLLPSSSFLVGWTPAHR